MSEKRTVKDSLLVQRFHHQEAYMPKCLADVKVPPKPKRENAAQEKARNLLNKKLEAAAREIEALARNMPSWGPALSSAAERVRSKKEYGAVNNVPIKPGEGE